MYTIQAGKDNFNKLLIEKSFSFPASNAFPGAKIILSSVMIDGRVFRIMFAGNEAYADDACESKINIQPFSSDQEGFETIINKIKSNAEIMVKFSKLASQLSPENLYCDGELSQSQAVNKAKIIKHDWVALEKEFGRKISIDEVEHWIIDRQRNKN